MSRPQQDEPIIEVEDLNMYYGSFKALSDVNMEMAKKGSQPLLARRGCGKSTFI